MDKHRKMSHGIPLPSTKTTRHAERTSVPPIFSTIWILSLKTCTHFKHCDMFDRYGGRYDEKQTDLPNEIKNNMSRLKKKGYVDYGWKIKRNDEILKVKKKHSKKSINLMANFMNQIYTLQQLYPRNLDKHLMELMHDYPKSRETLIDAMKMIVNYTQNI